MTIASSIQQMETILIDTYNAIAEMGGTIPENKNWENVAAAVDSIPTAGGDLLRLKSLLNAGIAEVDFPINSEIADTYGDTEIKWVVGHYGTATMSDGSVQKGVFLFTDRIVANMAFGPNMYYNQSTIHTWLNTTFLSACSDALNGTVGEISVTGSDAAHAVNAKVWLMSTGEIIGQNPSSTNGGGVAWNAWKIRTGLSRPSSNNNAGRIMKYNGSANAWWDRSIYLPSYTEYVGKNGSVSGFNPTQSLGIVPAWFMPKD